MHMEKPEESALVFDIEKFALHDGPGVRTVVFLKGCPLHCLWCHNSESQSFKPEIMFRRDKCISCGFCVSVCPQHCHKLEGGKHSFDHENCTGCGKCPEKCFSGALKTAGRNMSVSQVLESVMKDQAFYDHSGGGLTLSGGEPLAHFEFVLALLREAQKRGLHTAVETSGFAPWEKINAVRPFVDLWLWDVKASKERHQDLTGVPADPILANLRRLDESGANIILRCPLVPEKNDRNADLLQIAGLANSLKSVVEIDLEPYHPLGESKSEQLGRKMIFHSGFVSEERKKHWVDFLKTKTAVPVYIR